MNALVFVGIDLFGVKLKYLSISPKIQTKTCILQDFAFFGTNLIHNVLVLCTSFRFFLKNPKFIEGKKLSDIMFGNFFSNVALYLI